MRHARRLGVMAGALALTIATAVAVNTPARAQSFGYQNLTPVQKRFVSGLLAAELGGGSVNSPRVVSPLIPLAITPPQPGVLGCTAQIGSNTKVNNNCLNVTDADLQGRGQAQNETAIAVDPNNPNHLVASYNDYRRGDGTCGVSYSLNGGGTWSDSTTPNGFTRGTFVGSAREYWQAGGDTSVAWDTKGNAYLSCQVFNRGSAVTPNPDQSSAFYVYRSTGTAGASFNFPGRAVVEHNDTAGAGTVLLDKQLLTVDNHPGSPFADRVYVTWTTFAADGTAYIYEAHSADYGETFSAPVLVSGANAACTNTFGAPTPSGPCNENQYSQPFTAPNGDLYVTYSNFNNQPLAGTDNHYQVLVAKSADGGATFSAPVKVSDYYDLPDCDTYQGAGSDPGRSCVIEKGSSHNSVFRASNYPIGAVDPTNPNHVVITFPSYINTHSNESNGCTPAGFAGDGNPLFTGVKSGSCNNDILYKSSTNGGASFTGTTDPRTAPDVTATAGQASTDQFWQGAAFDSTGSLTVGYFDRSYGSDNTTGFSDYTVSGSLPTGTFLNTRATSSSMPPPTEFSGQFYGDYGLLAVSQHKAYPIWADTRTVDQFLCPGTGTVGTPPAICSGSAPNAAVANDQDIYGTIVGVP